MKQMLDLSRLRSFGRSSEQTHPDQGQFENLLKECDSLNGILPEKLKTEKLAFERRKKNSKLNGREKIPEHLERVEKLLDLSENEKICPVTNLPMIKIGEDITERLAYKPGKLFAIRYIRPKYVSPDRRIGNEVGVMSAPISLDRFSLK